jgi:acyl-CoA dehydrogenase
MPLDPDTLSALIETVRRFVHGRLRPLEDQVEAEDRVPDAVVAEMRELGLFGLSIPEEYGGLGLSMAEEAAIAFELGGASPAFRSVIGTNNGIGSQSILIDGTPEQKAHYLPRLASGDMIGSFALTEPDSGSDAASLKTRAVRDGDIYILNGTKRFITNAPQAGLFTVFARSDPSQPGARGVSAFLVEAGTPGLSVSKPYQKMGQRGSAVADVHFHECRVPASQRLGEEGRGFRTAMKVLDRGRLHISAFCVGIAERLIADALRFATERRQFGERIADFQLVQAMLADSRTEAFAARSMVEATARKYDGGATVTLDASCCKLFASEMVGRVADRAVQIHGGSGYIAGHAVERLYRDVRLFRLYEGTSQIQQIVIAREMLKNP